MQQHDEESFNDLINIMQLILKIYNLLHYLTEYLNYFPTCISIPLAMSIDFHTFKKEMSDCAFHYLNDFVFL